MGESDVSGSRACCVSAHLEHRIGVAGQAVAVSHELVEPLSDRELEVLRLLASGMSNREIADELVVALDTVKKHVSHIFAKLGVSSRTQAAAARKGA